MKRQVTIKDIAENNEKLYAPSENALFLKNFTTNEIQEIGKYNIEGLFQILEQAIQKVNAKNVNNKKAHFKQINIDLEQTANQLVEKINAL